MESPDGPIVCTDQQTLADPIGSVREVVARELRKLREAGVIERHNRSIKITEAEELHQIAKGAKGIDFGMEPRPRRQFVDGRRPGRG
jgi:Crp-like helix-turn-helix domain